MTPGRFHAETGAAITLPANTERDIPLRDLDGHTGTLWLLANGDTTINVQVSDVSFGTLTDAQKPKEIAVWLVRYPAGLPEDFTQRFRRTVKAGVKTWADGFGGLENISETDGLLSFRISHDGTQAIRIGKVVVKANNERAQLIHDLGGYNLWSDGVVR